MQVMLSAPEEPPASALSAATTVATEVGAPLLQSLLTSSQQKSTSSSSSSSPLNRQTQQHSQERGPQPSQGSPDLRSAAVEEIRMEVEAAAAAPARPASRG
ncbi:MAG: hypothetical protein WDW38_005526 [Sanguina aurantia]